MSTGPAPTNSPPSPQGTTPAPASTPAPSPTPEPAPAPTPEGTPAPTPEGTPAPTPAPEPVAPLTAESLKFAEGFTVDEKARDEFITIMNDDKLSGAERAQKLVDLQQSFIKQVSDSWSENLDKEFAAQQETWVNEVKADPELGGDKMEPALAEVAKLVETYGSQELKDILDQTGAGNNIHVVRFMHSIAKVLNESGGLANGNPPPDARTPAQRLFPSMK